MARPGGGKVGCPCRNTTSSPEEGPHVPGEERPPHGGSEPPQPQVNAFVPGAPGRFDAPVDPTDARKEARLIHKQAVQKPRGRWLILD